VVSIGISVSLVSVRQVAAPTGHRLLRRLGGACPGRHYRRRHRRLLEGELRAVAEQ